MRRVTCGASSWRRVARDVYSAILRSIRGVSEPDQRPAPFGRQHVEIDPADAALLEFERRARADEMRGQLAQIRLVPDERDVRPCARASRSPATTAAGVPAGASASDVVTGGLFLSVSEKTSAV